MNSLIHRIDQPFLEDRRYYNPSSFMVLSPLFSLLLPGVLFALNVGQSGNKKDRNILLAIFVVMEVLFFGAVLLFGQTLGKNAKYIFEGINVGIGGGLFAMQKVRYDLWRKMGGSPRPLLAPILISAVPVAALILVTVSAPLNNVWESKIGNNSIFYDTSIDGKEIEQLGKYLLEVGLIEQNGESRFLVRERNGEYEFMFPTKTEYINSQTIVNLKKSFELLVNAKKILSKKVTFIQADNNYKEVK